MGGKSTRWRTTLAAGIVALAAATSAVAEVRGRNFSSDRWNVSLATPRNWQITEATPYDSVLIAMVTRSPRGTMMLSAQANDEGLDAPALAHSTAELLAELGFETTAPQLHPATGAYWIDITAPRALIRQAFLAAGDNGYTLTLSAETARDRAHHLRAFDAVLRSIRVDRASRAGDDS